MTQCYGDEGEKDQRTVFSIGSTVAEPHHGWSSLRERAWLHHPSETSRQTTCCQQDARWTRLCQKARNSEHCQNIERADEGIWRDQDQINDPGKEKRLTQESTGLEAKDWARPTDQAGQATQSSSDELWSWDVEMREIARKRMTAVFESIRVRNEQEDP